MPARTPGRHPEKRRRLAADPLEVLDRVLDKGIRLDASARARPRSIRVRRRRVVVIGPEASGVAGDPGRDRWAAAG